MCTQTNVCTLLCTYELTQPAPILPDLLTSADYAHALVRHITARPLSSPSCQVAETSAK